MKLGKLGRIAPALAVSLGMGFGMTSCSTNHTTGYLYVTAAQYNQISAFRIFNNIGNLIPTQNSPYGSGGVNPIKDVVANGGRFLYVLNAGCGGTSQIACPAGTPADETGANISLFTIGGAGALSFQQSYTSQGSNPVSMLTDLTGLHLFILDSQVPNPAVCTGYVSTNPASICGDITAFNIDPNTGRLSLITNQQVKDAQGTNLTYFPVGSGPIEFNVIPAATYIYTIEKGSGSAYDPLQAVFVYALNSNTGQLTLTQNTPIPTNAIDLSFIQSTVRYVYLIDAASLASSPAGQILPYTVGTNGALQSLVGGAVNNSGTVSNPGPMVVDHSGKFLYLANLGPNLTPSSSASSVSAFFIDPITGRLTPIATPVPFGAGASPRCILEDPTNQYLYTANYNDSTVTGAVINIQTGTLTALRSNTSAAAAGEPTWCVASGTTF